jgi:small subunit ribosomal protein S18
MTPPVKRKIKVPKNCPFCKESFEPDFKDVVMMSKYVNDRGRIVGRDRTGICAKHQRRLSKAIKRARQVALMPFVMGV